MFDGFEYTLISSNGQRGLSISVHHGKCNEFNSVVCVRMKTVSVEKGFNASLSFMERMTLLAVSDGRLFERMRAVVFLRDISKSLKGSNPRDVWEFAL